MSDAAPVSPDAPTPESAEEASARRFETVSGLTLAVFAAVLAVTDLGGGKYGDDEIIGTNERANLYSWYQSKSIKQSLVEQEGHLLQALLDGGVILPASAPAIQERIAKVTAKSDLYDAEKKEILEGSAAVGPAGQVLETDGQKGQIFGTKPWEAKLATLGASGDVFDMATLWLQLSLVLGAIALVLQGMAIKRVFYGVTVVMGIVGTVYAFQAFSIATAAG